MESTTIVVSLAIIAIVIILIIAIRKSKSVNFLLDDNKVTLDTKAKDTLRSNRVIIKKGNQNKVSVDSGNTGINPNPKNNDLTIKTDRNEVKIESQNNYGKKEAK